jgi:AmmeMemoRadiSam system protein A
MLTEEQKVALLRIARGAVVAQVHGEGADVADAAPVFPDAAGAFVTIKRHGELRGCLGTLTCQLGLEAEVARCAADAASQDPRFPRVTADELPHVNFEVSVLGPLEPIEPLDARAITIGRHGLVAEQGRRRGLLLPQVAVEWGWTVDQFLRQTCVKAGLPPDAWRHGARIYRFEAEVFGEPPPLPRCPD